MVPVGKYVLLAISAFSLIIFVWVDDREAKRLSELSFGEGSEVVIEDYSLLAHYIEKSKKSSTPEKRDIDREILKRVVNVYTNSIFEKTLNSLHRSGTYLELLATISPPRYKGMALQASDIDIYHDQMSNNTRAYISFNTQGEMMAGAIQVIKITNAKDSHREEKSSKKNQKNFKSKPVELEVEQTLVFKDTDIHSLRREGQSLFLVGATSDPKFKTPSVLEILSLHKGLVPHDQSSRIDLPSFAATSVVSLKEGIFVSVGDREGGVVRLDNKKSLPIGYTHFESIGHEYMPIEDPRDLAYTKDELLSVTGTQASLWIKNRKKNLRGEPPLIHSIEGATLKEAKSSIEVSKYYIYLGLGDGGTKILDLENYDVLGFIPPKVISGIDSALTVTNAVSADDDEIYTADGEGGSRVFQIEKSGDLRQVASIRFGQGLSVNSVKKLGSYVIFATGLGGVKIARLVKER